MLCRDAPLSRYAVVEVLTAGSNAATRSQAS